MKCAACGNENQASAKFCVHCGVVLSAASPAVAPAPPASSGPVFRPVPAAAPSATATAARPVAPISPVPPAATAPPATPASAAPNASRPGVIAGVAVALLIVLGAGGYFGYRMLAGGGEGRQATAAVEPPQSEAPTAPSEPAKEAAAPPATEPPAAAAATQETPQPTAMAKQPGAPAATPAGSPSVAVRETPGETGQEPGTPRKAAKAPSKAVAEPGVPGSESTSKAAAPAKAPATKAPVVASTAASAQTDRWQMFAEALAACAKEQLFGRFVCEQRARGRFCEGYWGKVPQCPSAAPIDHGQ